MRPKIKQPGTEPRQPFVSSASVKSYEKALRDAGVSPTDLALLRDLAAANATELDRQPDHLLPSRVRI